MAQNHQPLISHGTDSNADARRKVFGLTGNNYLYVAGGAILTLLMVHLAFNVGVFGDDIIFLVIVSILPAALSAGYVYGFLEGRAPHYQEDVWDAALNGQHFNYRPLARKPKHPLRGISQDLNKRSAGMLTRVLFGKR